MTDNNVAKSPDAKHYDEGTMLPPIDVIEDSSGITLYADLPGVPKNKLNVRVEGDTLAIEGEISLTFANNFEASHAEVQMPHYRRAFTLGQELDSNKIAAEFNQGVLKLRIPKAEHAKPRKIEVQVT